jgi:V/A-type H+-transporting ATPase subunit I
MWRDRFTPEVMERVAVVAPQSRTRPVLEALATTEAFEPDERHLGEPEAGPSAAAGVAETGAESIADPAEREWRRRADAAVTHGSAAIYAGWVPRSRLERVEADLADAGASVEQLPRPRGAMPPTLIGSAGAGEPFRLLIRTFGVIPYRTIDPALFAGATYAVMFGMMFGDVADGALLLALGIYARRSGRPRALAPLSALAISGGIMGIVFGFLYGEFFGPTEVLPVLWLSPLDSPTELLVAALILGSALLGLSYVLGTVNRWREAGAASAAYSASGLAGAMVFLGGVTVAGGWALGLSVLMLVGGVVIAVGALLLFTGFVLAAGSDAAAVMQAIVELFDSILRIASNVVSFSRLAAFGLTHAAIGLVVWDATTALSDLGGLSLLIAAAVVFVAGHLLSFALEVLVIGVQALRLEYYELFSRVLTTEGREFVPWRVPAEPREATP